MGKAVAKISYLDGIRGVAAVLVFFNHFFMAFYGAYYTANPAITHLDNWDVAYGRSVWSFMTNGNFCVCIFFVLSGFVLSRKYYRENDLGIVISGAQRRFLRLYIPIAFTVIISYILLKTHLYYNGMASAIARSEWWFYEKWMIPDPERELVKCLTYGVLLTGDMVFNFCLWSMSYEFYGSMMVFILLALSHNTRIRVGVLLLVMGICFYKSEPYLAAFVLGILLNYAERLSANRRGVFKTLLSLVLLVAGLVLGSFPMTNNVQGTIFERIPLFARADQALVHVAGGFMLVVAVVISSRLQRIAGNRFFAFLGRISFSFYLLHALVLGSFGCFVFLKLYGQVSYNLDVMITFVLTGGLSILAAWLMTIYIDEPGIKLSRYVYKRFISSQDSLGTAHSE